MSTADVITRAALDLFYRQGFHASGVEQLSQMAGVTKKTLYRHFPSKEHVVEAALQLRHAEFMDQMATAVEGADQANRPQAYIDFIICWVQSADFHGCAFINASAEYSAQSAPPHVLASQHKQQVLNYLQGICTQAGLTQPAAVAMQLFVIGEGLIVTSQVSGLAPAMLPAIREMVAVLCASSPRE
ncbi:TetR family transcriptional regulator [Pseudomonas sp. FSL R10-0399]|uniref:TetR/AcrR family transcriptional regulator n=1 Tax=Pseudomonas sp. FSL R10-0399 TaxID=2662194 RepID=UPI0012968562|nr:TetR/AcrR family transcriptional regulator [Pseudomonas sp. FSL R10-0399]MQT56686.1 TetR family transcriptional regulator [Pseudomonas sp. FSL R10-0399]